MNNFNFHDGNGEFAQDEVNGTTNGAYPTRNGHSAPHDAPDPVPAVQDAFPSAQLPEGVPPKAPSEMAFRMPFIEGDIYAPLPVFPDEKNKTVLKWFPPPIKLQEVEPLAALLEKSEMAIDAVGLRLRAVVAEEARRELEGLQGYLIEGLEEGNAYVEEHNKQLAPFRQYERALLAKREHEAREARATAASACAKAGLPFPCEDVVATLNDLAPSDEIISGAQGLVRFGLPRYTLLIDVLACLGSGFLTLVVGLGPILSVFDLKMLDELARTWPRLLIGTGLGAMIGWCLGAAVQQMTTQLAVRFLERKAGEPPSGIARLVKMFVPVIIGVVLLVLAPSEITVGATGIHLTSQDHLAHLLRAAGSGESARLMANTSLGAVPWVLCAMIAAVINTPYLSHKSLLTWNRIEAASRADWCGHQRAKWITEQGARPEVREASAALGNLRERDAEVTRQQEAMQQVENQLLDVRLDLDEASKKRLQSARDAAVGEADKLRAYTNQVVERLGRLNQRPGTALRGPVRRSWWSRLWSGLFGPRRVIRPQSAFWHRSRP